MPDFEEVEDGIIAAIKTQMPYVLKVETYAGQLDGEVAKLAINAPAIFVMYSGTHFEWADGQALFNEEVVFTCFLVAKNLRGNEAVRKDGETGCYKLIKEILKTITNKTFGLDIERLQPIAVKFLFATKTTTVYAVDFKTNFDTVY